MILPSIDLAGGQAVQLIGGAETAIEAGDPFPIAERFALAGEIAVIDLDAALGRGSNADLIERLVADFPCRVGGGIRDVAAARRWLDAGATQVILGTAAVPEILAELPRERVIAALDARHGEVVVEGWTKGTGRGIAERMAELGPLVGGFLVTFVEREGRLGGLDEAQARAVIRAAGAVRVTVAGGVTTAAEIRALDALGADAQVGMALYTGRLDLGDAIAAPVVSADAPHAIPVVAVDDRDRPLAVRLADPAEIRGAVASRQFALAPGDPAVELRRVLPDARRTALKLVVDAARSPGGWAARGLAALERRLTDRRAQAPTGSYTARLFGDADLLAAKLREEADELAAARTPAEVAWEAADVFYFAHVAMVRGGVTLAEVEAVLDGRARRVTRRAGDRKDGAGVSGTEQEDPA